MNILMVDQYGETGGAQKCLLDLISGWPQGDAVVVAAPGEGSLLGRVREAGYTTVPIPCGPYSEGRKAPAELPRFLLDVSRQVATLRRTIRRHAIDVVYVNGPRVLAGAALAARGRSPLVFHMHNGLRRWSEIALSRWALARCEATVIACCAHVARSLPEARPAVALNGVGDAGFCARQLPRDGVWRIGMVGRISPDKGHAILMDAARMLAADGHRLAITVAGASLYSAPAYAADVRKRAAGLDVQFTGWVDGVGALLRQLDLLVVPSTAEPGLPRVVLEAFSAGLPVVALPSGGIPEAVRDHVTGFLSPDLTAASLARTLRAVMLGPTENLARVARDARAEWETRWNLDRWRSEVISAIRATAAAPRRSGEPRSASSASIPRRPPRSA